MKYWAYLNNEVLGPFEKEKLKELANFSLSSLICPEGGQAEGWKEAAAFPEVRAALSPASAKTQASPPPAPQRMAEESPLALTMRGSLITEPAAHEPSASPAPAPDAAPGKFEEPPLAMTMRGTIIERPQSSSPASSAPPAPARDVERAALERPKESPASAFSGKAPAASENVPSRQEPEPQMAQLRRKLEQMSLLLTSMGDSQSQLLTRLIRLEGAITEIKALLLPPPPKH